MHEPRRSAEPGLGIFGARAARARRCHVPRAQPTRSRRRSRARSERSRHDQSRLGAGIPAGDINLYQRLTVHRPSPCRYIPTLLAVRPGGDRDARRRRGGWLAGPAAQPLSSSRWTRVRSRSRPASAEEHSCAHVLAPVPLDPLYYAIGWLLAFFYTFTHSLGLAMILLTLAVMLVQFPLIAKQTRSMIQMQRVQPEIKKIQQKYKDDQHEAERGAAEVLPREQDQPAGRVPAAARRLPDRYRGVPHLLAGCAAAHPADGNVHGAVQGPSAGPRSPTGTPTVHADLGEDASTRAHVRATTPRGRLRRRSRSSG